MVFDYYLPFLFSFIEYSSQQIAKPKDAIANSIIFFKMMPITSKAKEIILKVIFKYFILFVSKVNTAIKTEWMNFISERTASITIGG